MLGCAYPNPVSTLRFVVAVVALVLVAVGFWLFEQFGQPLIYNKAAAIAFARTADAHGAAPNDALAEIRRLPRSGCAVMQPVRSGAERCVERYGIYGYRPSYRTVAYAELANVYLSWPSHSHAVGEARPSVGLMRAVAHELEGSEALYSAPPIITVGPLASMQAMPRMLLPGALYKATGDADAYRAYVRRSCERQQWCLMNASIFEGDIDGAVAAAERLPYVEGNMGQRDIFHTDRTGLLSAAQRLGREDLVLRLSRALADERTAPPVR